MTDVAFAAGFASIRQFNATMQAAYGCRPTDLRRGDQVGVVGGGELGLRLSYRPPFAADVLLAYLARRTIPGVEEVVDGRYRRTVALPRSRGTIELEPQADTSSVLLRVCLDDLRDLGLLSQRCRQLFDLESDPLPIGQILAADPLLAPLIAVRPGIRVPGTIDGFELAVRAIVGQQISVAGARTLLGRLVNKLGAPLAAPRGALTHFFPSAAVVAESDLKGIGLTAARATSLLALAQAVATGTLMLDRGADREKTQARLLAVPGVGPWTASYIAMRALGDPDALPATDLGLRRALERYGVDGAARVLTARAEAWRPWRASGCPIPTRRRLYECLP